jgi:hypothetical protein
MICYGWLPASAGGDWRGIPSVRRIARELNRS